MHSKISRKETGYVLYIVLIILTVTAIFLSIIFKHLELTRKQTANELQKVQARLLAESGIIRAEYFLNGGDGHTMDWETDKFEERVQNYGNISIRCKRFGLFSEIESQGVRLKTSCTINGLFGRDIPDILKPSLTLTGHVGGLILYEGSGIDGFIVLHHGDIYLEKRGRPLAEYQNKIILRESRELPFDSTIIPEITGKMNKTHISLLSCKNAFTGNMIVDNMKDSLLKEDTIVILGNCQVKSGNIYDKLMVISGTLTMNNGASVQESQIYAENIIIDGGIIEKSLFFSSKKLQIQGGHINSQLFSQDSISCAKGVNFGSMTVFTCLRSKSEDSAVTGGIYFEDNTQFNGTVICCMDSSVKRFYTGSSIVFGKGSTISGCVITNHDLDIKEAQIKGHIWARTISTQYNNNSYTNYLIKSTIKKPDQEIYFPLIGTLPANVRGMSGLRRFYRK